MATKKPTKNDAPAAEVIGAQNPDGSATEASVLPAVGWVPPKVKRVLTLPLLKMPEGSTRYVQFTGPTFIGKKIVEAGKPAKEPPTMANVINLETGEMVQIMLGKVLTGILAEEYPSDGYVGKRFSIETCGKKRGGGNSYNTYRLNELE